MKRFVIGTLVPLLAILSLTLPANAGLMWCKTDPVITLNNTIVDITTSIPLEYVPLVNGPVTYEVRTPKDTERHLILNDAGFGSGSEVVFLDGAGTILNNEIPTKILVHVPIDTSRLAPKETVPVELMIIPANGAPLVVMGTSTSTTASLVVIGN